MQGIRTAVLAAIATVVLAPSAAAAPKADLTVRKLSEPPAALAPGAKLAVTDAVRNAGRRRARATTVVYWLSTDRRRNAGDVRIGRRGQKALKGRRTARGRTTLTLPASLAAGPYHLIACADGARRVSERSERNNCRASRGRLTLTALALPGGPPAPAVTPSPAPAPSPTATPTGAVPDFPLAADPLSVTHTLDTANAVTQRVQLSKFSGATVETTGADGTHFRLELPPGALPSPVEITMTPVKAVGGSPLSGPLLGAVEILPHGLELLEPATLTITPGGPAGTPAGQTGFLSHDQGEDFHLYPLDMGAELKLHLTHFSTPGVAEATADDRQVVLAHPPERRRAQLAQLMADILRDARVKALANENTDLPADQIAAILRAYWDDVVWPVVEPAQKDDTKATQALSEMLSWARQVDLLSLHGHPLLELRRDSVMGYVTVIIENAINQGYTRCVEDHDLDFIARLVGLARVAALLGLGLDEAALDKAERCGTFRLDFDARFTYAWSFNAPDGRTAQATGAWRVETPADGIEIPMSGLTMTGSLSYTEFSFAQTMTYSCGPDNPTLRYDTVGLSTTPDNDVWVLLGIDLNPREPGTPPPPNYDIRVQLLEPGDLEETYRETNPVWCGEEQAPPRDFAEERWSMIFNQYHQGFLFGGWTRGAGDVVATWDRTGSNANHGTTGAIHLVLRHVPAT